MRRERTVRHLKNLLSEVGRGGGLFEVQGALAPLLKREVVFVHVRDGRVLGGGQVAGEGFVRVAGVNVLLVPLLLWLLALGTGEQLKRDLQGLGG